VGGSLSLRRRSEEVRETRGLEGEWKLAREEGKGQGTETSEKVRDQSEKQAHTLSLSLSLFFACSLTHTTSLPISRINEIYCLHY
jgi:hypothetical protein